MYGIIHKSLREMVIRDYGQEKWDAINEAANHSEDVYVSMQTYADEITYDLIGAASKVLGAPVDTCLEQFGKYWILEAAPASYGNILDATGSEIISFINNINLLHDRITSTFPNYMPPEFYIEPMAEELYKIEYFSSRKGLSSFVAGLLKGVGLRFNRELEILETKQVIAEVGERWAYTVRIPA